MPGGLRLENFCAPAAPSAAETGRAERVEAEAETQRLAAWEAGYKQGWDDAARTRDEEQARIGADLAQSLQELGFTYHEARAHVLDSLEALLSEIVGRLLPELARQTLAPILLDELLQRAADLSSASARIEVAPQMQAVVAPLVASAQALPVTVTAEPTLDLGQAVLRLGASEVLVDLSGVIARLGDALDAMYQLNSEERRHA